MSKNLKNFKFPHHPKGISLIGKTVNFLQLNSDKHHRDLYLFPKLTIISGIAGKRMAGSKIKLSMSFMALNQILYFISHLSNIRTKCRL